MGVGPLVRRLTNRLLTKLGHVKDEPVKSLTLPTHTDEGQSLDRFECLSMTNYKTDESPKEDWIRQKNNQNGA